MKITGISFAILLSLTVFACQNPSRETGNDAGDPTREERVEEPQVRDGMPHTELRDSLATDTADTAGENTPR